MTAANKRVTVEEIKLVIAAIEKVLCSTSGMHKMTIPLKGTNLREAEPSAALVLG